MEVTLIGVVLLAVAASAVVAYLVSYRLFRRILVRVLDSISSFSDAKRLARIYGRRPRRRYIVFEVATTAELSMEDVEDAVSDAIKSVLGVVGLVESGFKLVYYDEDRRRGIIRVRHDYKFKVLGILGLVREVRGERVNIVPITVTGSLKNARKRLSA